MSMKSTAPISKSTVPVQPGQSQKQGGIKQTETKTAPKLDKEGQLNALFSTRKNVMIAIKAAIRSIGSTQTMAEIRTEMKSGIKAKFLDRFDQKEKANSQDNLVKGWPTKTLEQLTKASDKPFPFEMSKQSFKDNTKLLLSVQFDSFITEARTQGAKTDTQIRDYVTSRLNKLVTDRLSLNELLHYDGEKLLGIKDEFKSEGRGLKSEILHSFIITMDELSSKSGSVETFDAKSKTTIKESCQAIGKNPNQADAFLRGKDYNATGNVLFAHGMNDLAKHVERGILEINGIAGFSDMPPKVQLRNAEFKTENLAVLNTAALKVLDILQSFDVPDDLKQKLAEHSGVINEQVRKGALTEEQGKSLMHKFFNNAVILRVVNPSISSSTTAQRTNDRQLNTLAQFIQFILNGIDGTNEKNGLQNKAAGIEFNKLAGPLQNKFNQLLVAKFGMPNDVFELKPEPEGEQQVANNQNEQEPMTFEQYLAALRQPVGGNQGNDGNPPINN